jgi:putative hydrolase of HD superfamily
MLEEIIEFTKLVGKLKKIQRTGWVTRIGMRHPESVADHTFRVAILAMVLADMKKLDTEKVMRMALLHDLQEIAMGDWDFFAKKKLGFEIFERKERESIRKVLNELPKDLEKKYLERWEEFHENKTEEAKLVKNIDKIEFVIQAMEYEKDGDDKEKFEHLWKLMKKKFENSDLKEDFELLEKERRK